MISLWARFGSFCRNNPDLDTELASQIMWLLLNSPMSSLINPTAVSSSLSTDFLKLRDYFIKFAEADFVELRIVCPECETQQNPSVLLKSYPIAKCPNCESDIYLRETLEIKNLIGRGQREMNAMISDRRYEYAAQALSAKLEETGHLTYLVTDVVGSQQDKLIRGNEEYNKSLNAMWHSVWPSALRAANSPYLELNFTGDQSVVAFAEPIDALRVLLKFWAAIDKSSFSFDFMIGYVNLSGKERADQVLLSNIHHKWDLNMLSVDVFHRMFSKYPKNNVAAEDKSKTKIFLVLTDEVIKDLGELLSSSSIPAYQKAKYVNESFEIKGYPMTANVSQYLLPAFSETKSSVSHG